MHRPKVSNNRGNIIIRVSINGDRHEIAGLGKYSDPVALREAELIAARLYADMLSNRLLPDLQGYNPAKALILARKQVRAKPMPSLSSIYEQWLEYKAPTLAPYTLEGYQLSGKRIKALRLDDYNYDILLIRKALLEQTVDYAKRVSKHLKAATAWAAKHDKLPTDPLTGLFSDDNLANPEPVAKPFTAQQRDSLLVYMSQARDYKHYAGLTLFMFHTGCRPCEAMGLQWQDVDLERRQLTLGRSVVHLGNGTTQERGVSKTGHTRVFPFNKALTSLFGDVLYFNKFDSVKPVFSSKSGGYVNLANYRRRAWKHCVEAIGLDPSVYTPYSCRDTFITLALDKGYGVRDIAKLCDNSPDIIYRHYAGWVREVGAIDL
jgi:integrase